jgi:hypothetical protein
MHLICAPMLTKFYSCNNWVLQGIPRFSRIWDTSFTKVVSRSALMTWSASTPRRSLRSSMSSTSSSWLSQGLSPQSYASISTAMCSSRSCSLPSSSTFFSSSILSRPRMCLPRAVRASILSGYSYRVTSTLV